MGFTGGETGRSIGFYSLGRVAIEARTRLRLETVSHACEAVQATSSSALLVLTIDSSGTSQSAARAQP